MNIKCLREFDLMSPGIKHVRSAPVKMGEGKDGEQLHICQLLRPIPA